MYIVITGTTSGIGLQLTKIALQSGHNVLAIARNLEKSKELLDLKNKFENLQIECVDLLHDDSVKKIKDAISLWPRLDMIINNAGVYHGDHTVKDFQESFLINAIRPFFLTQTLLDKLRLSMEPKAVQISSIMGSITHNDSGGSYSYRSSKAALNMLFKCFSIEHSWLTTLLLHPGWVKTKMGGTMAPLTPEESANKIWTLILRSHLEDSGKFINEEGEILAW